MKRSTTEVDKQDVNCPWSKMVPFLGYLNLLLLCDWGTARLIKIIPNKISSCSARYGRVTCKNCSLKYFWTNSRVVACKTSLQKAFGIWNIKQNWLKPSVSGQKVEFLHGVRDDFRKHYRCLCYMDVISYIIESLVWAENWCVTEFGILWWYPGFSALCKRCQTAGMHFILLGNTKSIIHCDCIGPNVCHE